MQVDGLENLLTMYSQRGLDKWSSYFPLYENSFESRRGHNINFLEIGVQNGGSLEIWAKYFRNANLIIGCDVDRKCELLDFSDPRIRIVVGDISQTKTVQDVLKHSTTYDIIVDDGSHKSSDIILTFCNLWSCLADDGIYIVEDLHASYWRSHEGGVNHPYSSINFFKSLVDIVNYEHWGLQVSRSYYLRHIERLFCVQLDSILEDIFSITFYNSFCVIRKKKSGGLGARAVSGQIFTVDDNVTNFVNKALIPDDQSQSVWSSFESARHPKYFEMERAMRSRVDLSEDAQNERQRVRGRTALVVPYFNGSKFIDRCVESILKQSVPYDEIIIVDDGSTPNHADYVEKFDQISGIRVVKKPNGGQGSARNFGASIADADFISFLDQDDFLLADHNKILSTKLLENPDVGYVYGDAVEADGEGNIIRYGMIKDHALHPKENIVHFVGQDCFILPSASMITKSAFSKVGGFDEQFTGYEDDDLFLRLFRAGFKGVFIDEPVYVWCIHGESTSFSIKMSRSRLRYVKKLAALFPSNAEMNKFWFRDQIFPRFLRNFLGDIRRFNNDIEVRGEIIQNFDDLLQLASLNYVDKRRVRKFRFFLFMVRVLPGSSIVVFERVARRFGIISWIFN